MKVRREPIEGSPLQRLIVTDPAESDHHIGDQVGFYCPDCGAVDETKRQVLHEADCPHAGTHGRQHYDAFEPDVNRAPSPELDPSTNLTVIRNAKTSGFGEPTEEEVLAFECSCGNADEDIFEIVHDDGCPLAGRHGLTKAGWDPRPPIRADGGD